MFHPTLPLEYKVMKYASSLPWPLALLPHTPSQPSPKKTLNLQLKNQYSYLLLLPGDIGAHAQIDSQQTRG